MVTHLVGNPLLLLLLLIAALGLRIAARRGRSWQSVTRRPRYGRRGARIRFVMVVKVVRIVGSFATRVQATAWWVVGGREMVTRRGGGEPN